MKIFRIALVLILCCLVILSFARLGSISGFAAALAINIICHTSAFYFSKANNLASDVAACVTLFNGMMLSSELIFTCFSEQWRIPFIFLANFPSIFMLIAIKNSKFMQEMVGL